MDTSETTSAVNGLRLVERLCRLEIARLRACGVPEGDFRGLYLSDEDVDRLVSAPPSASDAIASIESELATCRKELAEFAARTATMDDPLGRLIRKAGLNEFEAGCLLLCLALEVDLRFERIFAYLQDDVTLRRPRVELALRLLEDSSRRMEAGHAFAADAPLRRLRLLVLSDEQGPAPTPLLARTLTLDSRIASFLLDRPPVDDMFSRRSRLLPLEQEDSAPPFPAELNSQLNALASLPAADLAIPLICLIGNDAAARKAVAHRLASGSQLNLLVVDFPSLAASQGMEEAFLLAVREAALCLAALLLDHLEHLKPDQLGWLDSRLSEARSPQPERLWPRLTLLGATVPLPFPALIISLPDPDFAARRALWQMNLGGEPRAFDPEALDALAGKFQLTGSKIASAMSAARGSAAWHNPHEPALSLDDLYSAARNQSTPILHGLARKLTPRYTWDDIILPPDAFEQLHEMVAWVEHRHVVYERWGFGRKLAGASGVLALFAGPSGTGKTMAAEILAGALGLDLYRIDLSGVVSKYIGETEKNLSHIFAEAETSNAILFFDEADALFGKRSEVRDSHDRYANIEISYLLQKMEEYSGVVILATNLKMNLDEAFMRRIHFAVDFPTPDEADRRRIWQAALPAELPRAADVDLDFLARKFRLTGGHIRNITLSAAFLAAANGRVVNMNHLIQATRREFQKLERLITPADFETYYELVKSL